MGKTYTTVQGDMWDSVAARLLGSANYAGQLMNANLQYRDYYFFPAGLILTLPELPEQASQTLPSWKKVKD